MTGLGTLASTAKRRVGWVIRDRFPNRKVVREVQGVRLVLPWSHRLPDYATWGPDYGQNLVELGRLLAEAGPLTLLDVGANVGDSTAQILHAADGKALCIEADRYYLDYLHANVDADDRVTVVEALLAVDDEQGEATTAVRTGGTTRFVAGGGSDAMPTVSPTALRTEFPDFTDLRLVKSDTDGYDVVLVPAIARAWAESHPVLFFEYDPYLTDLAGNDSLAVWDELRSLGYTDVGVWTHGGAPLARTTTTGILEPATTLAAQPTDRPRSRQYWDVAVVHEADTAGRAALDRLVPDSFSF